jgi:ubiquinone/menaquinone biosynthesis C-methylase UbiE
MPDENPYTAEFYQERSPYSKFRDVTSARASLVKWYRGLMKYYDRGWSTAYPLSSTVLEVGCGHGAIIEHLRRRGLQAVGLEYSQWLAAQLRSLDGTVSVGVADARQLPVETRSVGSLVAIEVIEHIAHPLSALREFNRVLRPGGTMILTTPNPRADMLPLYESTREPTHISVHTAAEWVSMVREAGFSRVTVDTVLQVPLLWRVRGLPSVTLRVPRIGPTTLLFAKRA